MIIFDFDQTLVDTSPVAALRAQRQWHRVMAQVPQLHVYDGVHLLFDALAAAGKSMAIVTKSPAMVPAAFVRLYNWPIQIVVGYHDVRHRKPHPEGLLLAMRTANARHDATYHVGDDPEDTEASNNANVIPLGAAWGLDPSDVERLTHSAPAQVFNTVVDLQHYLLRSP